MSKIRFISVDTSMSNLGIALGSYETADNTYLVENVFLVHTEPSNIKQVRKSAQDYERCRTLYTRLHQAIKDWQPFIAFAEMPTGSQSANGMKSYGISLMLIGTITVPVIQVTPQEVKVAATNNKQATKADMIAWAHKKWPHLPWLTVKRGGLDQLTAANEHLADACAAVEAGMRTQQWLQAVAISAGHAGANRVII